MKYDNLDPSTAAAALEQDPDIVLLDVRTEGEYRSHRVDASILIPVDQVEARHQELDRSKKLFIICEHGRRSVFACEILHALGFVELTNVTGGMMQWIGQGLGHVSG